MTVPVREGNDLSGTDKGEVQWIKEQDNILALKIKKTLEKILQKSFSIASNTIFIAGLVLVLCHTEKSCKASTCRQFSHEYLDKKHKINTSFISPVLRPLGAKKTGFNLKLFM